MDIRRRKSAVLVYLIPLVGEGAELEKSIVGDDAVLNAPLNNWRTEDLRREADITRFGAHC